MRSLLDEIGAMMAKFDASPASRPMMPGRSSIGFGGQEIHRSAVLTEWIEDWSGVRSPARARRRRKQGHPQRMVSRQVPSREVYQVGDTLVMHPNMADLLLSNVKGAKA